MRALSRRSGRRVVIVPGPGGSSISGLTWAPGEGVRGPRAGGWPLLSVGRGPGRVRPEDPPWWLARWWLRGLTGQGVVSVAVGAGGSPVLAGDPSRRAGGWRVGLWRVLAVTAAGSGHRRAGGPRAGLF